MKRLLLLRHGKSDWAADYSGDHERPLAPRGVKAAKLMGKFLTKTGLEPDVVLSSSAARARTTAELAAEAGDWGAEIRIVPGIYEAAPLDVLAEVRRGGEGEVVLVTGHEPTFSMLASKLVGGGEIRVVTAALVGVGFEVGSWSEIDFGDGELLFVIPPKLLSKAGF